MTLKQNLDSFKHFSLICLLDRDWETTDLNTKQIVNNLNKMRAKYRNFKDNWNKGEI